MRKFSFKLQRIEDLRKEQLRTAQKGLKRFREELRSEKKLLALLANDQEEHSSKLKHKSEDFLDLRELNWYKEYLYLVADKITEKKESLRKIRKNLLQLKELSRKREKEKKILEKAKQIKLNHFLSEFKKTEQKELDEIGRIKCSKEL